MVEMAKNLYKKLSDIKCPQVNKFSSSSFDWLFDDDDSQTFLEWFCNSVDSETNLTSTAELERLSWVSCFQYKFENIKYYFNFFIQVQSSER